MALDWNAVGALEPYRVRFLGQSCIGLRLVPWSLARFDSSFLGQSYQEGPFRPVRKNISLAATPKKAGVGRCNANAVATPTALRPTVPPRTLPALRDLGSQIPHCTLKKKEQTTVTQIKPPYSDGRVELNGGAYRIRDAQISWNTLFQDVPRRLGRFLSPPNAFFIVFA